MSIKRKIEFFKKYDILIILVDFLLPGSMADPDPPKSLEQLKLLLFQVQILIYYQDKITFLHDFFI